MLKSQRFSENLPEVPLTTPEIFFLLAYHRGTHQTSFHMISLILTAIFVLTAAKSLGDLEKTPGKP